MNCATSSALAAVAADCFYAALKATEDLDPFLRTVRGGMREAAAAAASECVGRFDREVAAQVPRSWTLGGRPSGSVATTTGKATHARFLYRDERGRNRCPTDEILGIPKRRRLAADAFLWLAERSARVSFGRAARGFAEVGGVEASAMRPWRAVRQEEPPVAADPASAPSRGGRGMGASPAPQVAREERVDPAVPPQPRAAARSKDPRGRPRSRRPPFARPDDGPASPGGAPPRRPGFQPDLLCYDSLRRAPIGPA